MLYEIQIFAQDRKKIIRFETNEYDSTNFRKKNAWDDLYYALGLAIDNKADKVQENDTLIGRINVHNTRYDDILDAMCEDLSSDLVRLLTKPEEEIWI